MYNVAGQRVKHLVDEVQEVGQHVISWNGTDQEGRSAGSGVYLYRLVADAYEQTRRLVLLK